MNPRKHKDALQAEGTYRKDRHEGVGYTPVDSGKPLMPDHIEDDVKALWVEITDMLEETGYLCRADRFSMLALCELISELMKDPKQFTAAQYTQLRLYLCEFGMTPASRARMPSGKPIEKGNAFDSLLEMSGADSDRLVS